MELKHCRHLLSDSSSPWRPHSILTCDLHSTELLLRRVLIKNPAPTFELDPYECFELFHTLYGSSDAGDFWHITLQKHLTKELGLVPTKAGLSVYLSFCLGELEGLNGSYVDDLLRAGTPAFKDRCQAIYRCFETFGDESMPITFARFQISKKDKHCVTIYQTFYLKKLEDLDMSSAFSEFRSLRMRMASYPTLDLTCNSIFPN